MKNILVLCCLIFIQHILLAQMPQGFSKNTVIYLVRHAEKEAGKDPVLTVAGRQRAQDLYKELQKKDISRIYGTPYKRTQMTGDSLSVKLHIDTAIYAADTTGADLIQKIISHNDVGKTILVIGHSNTIPALIRHLGVSDFEIKELAETSFDNLFIVTYKKGQPAVKGMQYGAASAISAGMQ
jgi:broad specificity phosphatase PhoE